MANISVCAKGHKYDSDVFPSCPMCKGGYPAVEYGNNAGKGETTPLGVSGSAGAGTTVPLTEEKSSGNVPTKGQTEPIFAAADCGRITEEPVAGWLVCIEGPCRGRDYRLFARITHIGRDNTNDICIPEDMKISADNHLSIGYDIRSNEFTMIANPAVKNPNYLNGKVVYTQAELKPYDVLEVGETKLVFVPFCCEHFQWGNNK